MGGGGFGGETGLTKEQAMVVAGLIIREFNRLHKDEGESVKEILEKRRQIKEQIVETFKDTRDEIVPLFNKNETISIFSPKL